MKYSNSNTHLVPVHVFAFLLLTIILGFSMTNMSYAQRVANLVANPNFTQSNNSKVIVGWSACNINFKCIINSTTGWNDSTSLQVSTSTNNKNTFSSINGNPISVTPGSNYDFIAHMKLNKFATKSHITIEGYDQTSKKWSQITQCPSGTNGPLQWKEFSCSIMIPEGTNKIRLVLKAGSSSLAGNEAVTWFDLLSISKAAMSQNKFTAGFIPSATAG